MSKLLIGSIDLTKIDKRRIVSADKDGRPFKNGAKYLNVCVWINDEVDQYGFIASIQENVSKAERESGIKGNYIGNLKNIPGQSVGEPQGKEPADDLGYEDDLPF